MELSERISERDKSIFCRMLNVKELPEHLLKEYFRVKKLVDRIDSQFTPGAMVFIALGAGFNPDTMSFVKVSGEPTSVAPDEQAVATELDSPTVAGPTEPASDEENDIDEPDDDDSDEEIAAETEVQILNEGQIQFGRVVKSSSDKNGISYQVRTDGGEMVTVSPEDIQVL